MAEFSQPRNLVGGHTLSALIGVAVFMLVFRLIWRMLMPSRKSSLTLWYMVSFFNGVLIALGFDLVRTFKLRAMGVFTLTLGDSYFPFLAYSCFPITGGEKVHALGFIYLLFPVLAGSLIMLLVALLVNNLSANPKRHYPVYWL